MQNLANWRSPRRFSTWRTNPPVSSPAAMLPLPSRVDRRPGDQRKLPIDDEPDAAVETQRPLVVQRYRQADPLEPCLAIAPEAVEEERRAGAAAVLRRHGQVPDERLP